MQPARVLIVEDDAILASHLEEILYQLRYEPTGMAATGEEALQMAVQQKPDAILMDIRLRGAMNGIQAAELIYQQADIPIIYLTAYTEETLVAEARLSEAYAYLAKPVRDRELRASLEMAIYKHASEKHLKRLNQILRAVRDVNQLITREHDAQRLLDAACQILYRTRGYRLVWIARESPGEHPLFPAAHAGEHADYLDNLMADCAGGVTDRCPAGIAYFSHVISLYADLAADPPYEPWRKAALECGFVAAAAIPMLHEQRIYGVLSVFSDTLSLFRDEEIELLDEVARDLAFALQALEEEAARRSAEKALQESEARYKGLFTNLVAGYALHEIICDEQGQPADYRFLDLNPAFEIMTGLKRERVIGKTVLEVLPGVESYWIERYGRVALTGEPVHFEQYSQTLGKYFEVSAFSPQHGQFAVTFTDVTERAQAEKELRERNEQFSKLASQAPGMLYQFMRRPDGSYCVPYTSQAIRDLFGCTPEEAREDFSPIARVILAEDLPRVIHSIEESAKNLTRFQCEYRVQQPGQPVRWLWGQSTPEKLPDGSIIWYGFNADISERKQAEEQRRFAEENYRSIFEHAPVGIFQTTPSGRYLNANQALANIYGYASPEELIASVTDLAADIYYDPADRLEFIRKMDAEGEIQGEELRNRRKDGSLVWISRSARAVRNAASELLYYEGFLQDITERKQTEQSLRESEARYRNIFEGVQDAIFVETPDGKILDVNQRACEMYGYSHAEFLTKTVNDLLALKEQAVFIDPDETVALPEYLYESSDRRANGEIFPAEFSCRHQEINGEKSLFVVLRDITERKRAEETIRVALQEKEALLRELYHRTKNNMQVISALLNMEADRSSDEHLKKSLRDMDNRIISMSLVHEKLYQSKNLARIELNEYIANLAALLLNSYQIKPDKVKLSLTAAPISVSIENAVPCGLLVNEIISNSLKHAFPGERTGEIKIDLTRLEGSQVLLEISDDGIGLLPGIDLEKLKSLGMRIIFGIAGHQLHATVQVEGSAGVHWRVLFPHLADPLTD